jgi:hypothetical protein
MSEHERCQDVTCPTCSTLPDAEPAAPTFRLMPRGRTEQSGLDGGLYRVHTFFVVDADGQIVTDETDAGPQPIVLQSVPMRIKAPSRLMAAPAGMVLH